MKISFYTISLIIAALGIWHLSSAQPISKAQPIPSTFKGNLLAISDADMIATAYATGQSNKIAGIEDSLMHIGIEQDKARIHSRIHTTNSVISWPAILEWHPLQKYAYIAETRGKITPDNNTMKNVYHDYPTGQKITVVDYQNPAGPTLIQEKIVGKNLQNVSINHSGDLLVAATTEKGKEMLIATLQEGLIDQLYYFSDEEINYTTSQDGGFRTAEFHPIKNIIAVNLNGKKVAFFKVLQSENGITIERLGKSIAAGKKLSVGNWHPSGAYFMVSDVGWGNGNLGFAFNKKGYLVNVGFDEAGNHRLVSKVKVGLSPEGFDLSSDGNYAIAVNMRRTYLPKKFWFIPARKKSSLSLVKIDPQTGQLRHLGKAYGFDGILPEDAIFDQDNNSLAVAVYHDRDEGYPTKGWIDFWEIQNERLIKTNTRVYVTRGIHNLLLIP